MSSSGFDWRQYLTLAGRLQQSSDPATIRTVISRAYYAVYHLGTAYATKNGYTPPPKSSHAALIQWFLGQSTPKVRGIGYALKRLRDRRVQADYQDAIVFHTPDAQNAVADAQRLVQQLAHLP